jgi:hypothetical protein
MWCMSFRLRILLPDSVSVVRNNTEAICDILFSDEAWFHLRSYMNSQNSRLCSSENSNAYHETPLHPVKIGAWCAVPRLSYRPDFP